MGKGASTNQSNVAKKLPEYSSDRPESAGPGAAAGAGGGAVAGGDTPNACLITFREKLSFREDAADLIKVGFQFTLVPNEQGDLEMFSSGRIVGRYTGSRLALLKRCIGDSYIYRGVAKALDATGADCEVTGFGVGDEAASNM